MNNFYKNMSTWLLLVLGLFLMFNLFNKKDEFKEISFSKFVVLAKSGGVKEVSIRGQEIKGIFSDAAKSGSNKFKTIAPEGYTAYIGKLLEEYNMVVSGESTATPLYASLIISFVPILLFIGIIVYFFRRQMGGAKGGGFGGAGNLFNFGKSKARLLNESNNKVTFNDVAGVPEAKEELEELVKFLKNPKKFTALGGRIPKGFILVGPPGTGKTLLARAVAGEAGVPFFTISGSDFVEMYVGVGAARVRDLFEQGKKRAPCIIFIDEIDAAGRHRGAGLGGGNDEREQTLNALLVEMDGFEANVGLIIIAATNRTDVLDPALLRPGRFDRQVVLSKPDINGREAIFKVHVKGLSLGDDVDFRVLAKSTPGFTGADIANMCNEAALYSALYDKERVEMESFEKAKDKVMMGVERRSMVISDKEKRIIAYHEAGHAIASTVLPEADPVHKVSIIPRGMALGVTVHLPIDDRHFYTKGYLKSMLVVLMAGRVAEELVNGVDNITNGAGNDMERASLVARKMICEWGMSEDLGPIVFGKRSEAIFMGKEFGRQVDYSEEMAKRIDLEVKKLIVSSYERAQNILGLKLGVLCELAKTLLEKETIDGEVVRNIVG